uniref:Uncharacterized protein n=1 Tax=Acrobeloides nanus TaxID=290746 RepID=A0A914DAN6_9BILA
MSLPQERAASIIHGCTISSDGKLLVRTHSVPDFNALNQLSDAVQYNRYKSYVEHSDLGNYWYNPDRYYQRDFSYDHSNYPHSYWYRNKNPLYDWTYPYSYQRFSSPYYVKYLRNLYLNPYVNYGLHRNSRY